MYITYGVDGIVTYSSLKGEQKNNGLILTLFWCLILVVLTAFILYLTASRIKREKEQDELYAGCRKLKEYHDIDAPAEFLEGLTEMKLD